MVGSFFRRAAPIAALALGMAVSACSYDVSWNEVSGVPLAELDTSGDAPTRVELAGPDEVIITEGDALVITVEGDSEAADALRFDRDGDSITIARDQSIFDGRGKATVRMTMPAVSALAIAGSGKIEADTMASEAEIDIAGSGSITVANLAADKLEIDIAGSGDVTASGTARTLSVEIAGSGNVRLGALSADDVKVEIAGSGNVDVASDGTVEADIAGAGNVTVTGSATCSMESAGSGTVTCRPAATAAAPAATDEGEDEEEAAAE